jgi:hypothetical protein
MNLELSLTEIFLVLFVVTGLPRIWRRRRELIQNKAVWLVSAFALLNTISLLWTANLARGVLTVGLIWLLVLAFFVIFSNRNLVKFLPALLRVLLISSVVFAIFAWLQVIFATWNADLTLCTGCTASQFGFARATGLAIEPQFFGSLLLAPILLVFYLKFKDAKKPQLKLNLLAIFLVATLFLTLSRGAIYAFAIGLLVLLVLNFRQIRRVLTCVGLALGGFFIALVLQGTLAQLNPNLNESFVGATTKVVHQLSLGVIDIRPTENEIPANQSPTQSPNYDGYVEESTDIRLSLSQIALETWSSSTATIIFGTGVGGSGVKMNATRPDQINTKEIVQNEYLEVLLELGLVGLLLFAVIILGLFYVTRHQKWLWAIFAAFLIQWFFFSGYPNALHIYLTMLIIFLIQIVLKYEHEEHKPRRLAKATYSI